MERAKLEQKWKQALKFCHHAGKVAKEAVGTDRFENALKALSEARNALTEIDTALRMHREQHGC